MTNNEMTEKHNQAMDLAEKAELSKNKLTKTELCKIYREAMILEKEVALNSPGFWQTIYVKSAAWLAINAEEFDDAYEMADFGLTLNPIEGIKQEMLDIMEQSKKLETVKIQECLKGMDKFFPCNERADDAI